jgi:hypothetical protein
MRHTRINTPVIALAVWCTASILTLGTLKTVQADDSFQSREMVQEAYMPYTEQDCSARMLQSETSLSVADYNVPKMHTEDRLWSAECSGIDLQVPKTLVWALLTEETDSRIVDLQVPQALLRILYTEGCMQGCR